MRSCHTLSLTVVAVLSAGSQTLASNGFSPRVNYALHCQGCHLPDGRGMPNKVPDMRNMLGRFISVAEGREYLVRVPGTANSKLDDEDTAAVLNWLVKETGPVPPTFAAYNKDEVRALRKLRLREVKAYRARLIGRMSPQRGAASRIPEK